MKMYYATITSPAAPGAAIRGILNLYEGGDGGTAGEALGGDSGTIWKGSVHEATGINIAVMNKVPNAAMLSHVSGTVTNAAIQTGIITTGTGTVAGTNTLIPLNIAIELLK